MRVICRVGAGHSSARFYESHALLSVLRSSAGKLQHGRCSPCTLARARSPRALAARAYLSITSACSRRMARVWGELFSAMAVIASAALRLAARAVLTMGASAAHAGAALARAAARAAAGAVIRAAPGAALGELGTIGRCCRGAVEPASSGSAVRVLCAARAHARAVCICAT